MTSPRSSRSPSRPLHGVRLAAGRLARPLTGKAGPSRQALLLLAVVTAIMAQTLLRSENSTLGWVIVGVAIVLFLLNAPRQPLGRLSLQAPEGSSRNPRQDQPRSKVLVAAGALSIGAVSLFHSQENGTAWILFVLSVLCWIGAFMAVPTWRISVSLWPWIPLVAILAVAAAARFWNLGSLPFGTWYDEAFNGNLAKTIIQDASFRPVFYGADTLPSHMDYLFALSMQWFGAGTASMRYVTAAFGVLSVLLAFLVFRRWFGEVGGLVAAGLLAVMRYDITFSRIAMHGVTTPAFELAGLYLLDRALEYRRPRDFAWLGLVMGLGLSFYTPYRTFPVIMVAFVLLLLVVNLIGSRTGLRTRFRRSAWYWQASGRRWWIGPTVGLGVLVIGTLIGVAPVLQYAVDNSDIFFSRTANVSLFENRDEPILAKALWNNTAKHMLMFNVLGDRNGRHNLPNEPMLDPITGGLFLVGAGASLWRWRSPISILNFSLFALMLLPGILSVDFEAPQGLRSIGVIPALIYFSTVPLVALTENVTAARRATTATSKSKRRRIPEASGLSRLPSLLAVGGLVMASAYFNIQTYFVRQAGSPHVWAEHSAAETIVARELNRFASTHELVLSAVYDNHPTVHFLAGTVKDYQRWTAADRLPLLRRGERGVVMLLDPALGSAYQEAKRFYPGAVTIEHRAPTVGGGTVLYEVIAEPEDLRAVSGAAVRYYAGSEPDGQAQLVRVLDQLAVDWRQSQPLPLPFLAEVEGVLFVPEAGPYRFEIRGNPEARLWIDEYMIEASEINLAIGLHAIRMRIPGEAARVEVWWQPPGAPQSTPIPAENLFRAPVTNNGLLGEYFQGLNWAGEPIRRQVDPEISFYYHITPLPEPFTARWAGKLYAPVPGEYAFVLNSNDESRLDLDGKVILENAAGRQTTEEGVSLTRGWHDIEVRLTAKTGATQIYLSWIRPGDATPEIIPASFLLPPMGRYPPAP